MDRFTRIYIRLTSFIVHTLSPILTHDSTYTPLTISLTTCVTYIIFYTITCVVIWTYSFILTLVTITLCTSKYRRYTCKSKQHNRMVRNMKSNKLSPYSQVIRKWKCLLSIYHKQISVIININTQIHIQAMDSPILQVYISVILQIICRNLSERPHQYWPTTCRWIT